MNNTIISNFIRSKKITYDPSKDDVEFQIIDCYGEDVEEQQNDRFQMKKYRINLFGITKEGHSIYCEVNNFTPYFFVQCPVPDWGEYDCHQFKTYLQKNMGMDEEWTYNIKDVKLVKAKIFRGFTANKQFPFMKISFKSYVCMKECKKLLYRRYSHNGKLYKLRQFESNIDPLLRFFHRRQIKPCSWMKIDKDNWKLSKKGKSRCQFELKTNWMYCDAIDKEQIAPIVIASFDIECTSEDGSFPQFNRMNDPVIQIGTSIDVLGRPDLSFNHIITLKSCDPIDDAIVEHYETEREVLLAWTRFIQQIDPDIITGYNIHGFDYEYMCERAKLLKCDYKFGLLGRLNKVSSRIQMKELSSAALGKNFLKLLPMIGRVSIDLMRYAMGNFKLNSYKLDSVSQHFLGKEHKKNPITPRMIFDYQKIDSKHRKIVAEYCVQDCKLVNYLMNKLCVVVNNVGMANVCYVPFSYLFLRGQQVKIFSLISKECRENGFLIPILNKSSFGDDGYQGATVLNADAGFYKEPVVCLDYASLYPSTMISENLSVDTLVMNNSYMNLPGYEYKVMKINDEKSHTFVQAKKNKDGSFDRGLIPNILIRLLQARKDTKKRMKDEKDAFMNSILDGLQLSYKVVCNSVYGSMGASISPVYCQPVAESTTAMGRWYLELGRDKVLEKFPGTGAVYGDSVTKETPLLLKDNQDNIIIKRIDELNNEWKSYEEFKPFDTNRKEKEQTLSSYKIWTDKGWSNIKRVIRHKTEKKIYRILTHTGYVEVTEDHSLLNEKREKVKPNECNEDTLLLQSYPFYEKSDFHFNELFHIMHKNKKIESKENIKAFIYGFFFGDGSSGKYKYEKSVKYSWALNNTDINILHDLKELCEIIYNTNFKILDTYKSSNTYKLVPINTIKKYVEEYNALYSSKREKIIPTEILNGNNQIKKYFLSGYYLADGSKCLNEKTNCIRFDTKNQISASMLYYVMKSIGLNVSLNTRKDKPMIFRLTCTKNKQRKIENKIKKIEYLKTISFDDYVYDIETEEGVFQAGIGNIIVKNTDSCFYKFDTGYDLTSKEFEKKSKEEKAEIRKKALQKAIDIGFEAEAYMQTLLPYPHKFEYEKTYLPFILFSKKRYTGKLYETDVNKAKYIDAKGIVLKRRDNAKIVKTIYGNANQIVMDEIDIEKAKNYVIDALDKVVKGKMPKEEFIVTKTYKPAKTYKAYKTYEETGDESYLTRLPAQVILGDRIAERDPGNAPQSNERLKYIYIEKKEKKGQKILQGDKIETPEYIKEKKLKIDYLHYITNQLQKPLTQLFIPLLLQNTKLSEKEQDKEIERIMFADSLRYSKNKKNGMKSLESWFIKK